MMDNEMKDLAARMAADEANEGNYTAAAELKDLSEWAGLPFAGETSIPADIDLSPLDGILTRHQQLHGPVDDAPTGPLTPGQVECRVCQLNDRTRAASSPDDLLCGVCREDTPNRVRRERWSALRSAAAIFLGLEELEDDETAAGSMERDLINERIGALMQLAELVDGHMLPYKLVNVVEQACAPVPEDGAVNQRESDADAARRFAGQCIELQKRVDELEASERNRKFVEKSLDRLKPQLARRIAAVICPALDVSKEEVATWPKDIVDARMAAQATAETAAQRLVDAGLRFMPSTPETELATKHLRFVVACTAGQTFLQDWDGELFGQAREAGDDLDACRERINRAGTRAPEAANWGVFGLVRVPDEVVFGTEANCG